MTVRFSSRPRCDRWRRGVRPAARASSRPSNGHRCTSGRGSPWARPSAWPRGAFSCHAQAVPGAGVQGGQVAPPVLLRPSRVAPAR